jgi:hypothetical protein
MCRYELIKTLEDLYGLKKDQTEAKRIYEITTPLMSRIIIIKFHLHNWKIYTKDKKSNKKQLIDVRDYFMDIPKTIQDVLVIYRRFHDKQKEK